jgi:hypothetical protein
MRGKVLLAIVTTVISTFTACSGDTQTVQRDIDQDIIATHDAGAATMSNIGRQFSPWHTNLSP